VPGPINARADSATATPPPTWRNSSARSAGSANASAVKSFSTCRRSKAKCAFNSAIENDQS
jgi:hypothetical protein